jgi:hypothetical protein
LFASASECMRRSLWSKDQALRFRLGEVLALIEAGAALVELFDPCRRSFFMGTLSSPLPSDEPGYRHALAFLAAKACEPLLHCAAASDLSTRTSLQRVQGEVLRGYNESRFALAAALTMDKSSSGQTSAQMAQ